MVLEAEEGSDSVSDNPRHPDPARARDFTHFTFQFKATPTQHNANATRITAYSTYPHTPKLTIDRKEGRKKKENGQNEENETTRGIRKEKKVRKCRKEERRGGKKNLRCKKMASVFEKKARESCGTRLHRATRTRLAHPSPIASLKSSEASKRYKTVVGAAHGPAEFHVHKEASRLTTQKKAR